MNKRSMRILGFYQVQNMLVRLAPSRLSKEIARRLRPVNDSEVIERNLTDTEEAVRCMQTETSTPFGGIVDIRPSLEKAKREVTLIRMNVSISGIIFSIMGKSGISLPTAAPNILSWPNRPTLSAIFPSCPILSRRSLTTIAKYGTMRRRN